MRIVRAALFGASLGLLACGGSSSESPWPVEPLDAIRGPKGELLPGKEASDLAPGASAEDEEGAEGEAASAERSGAEGAALEGAPLKLRPREEPAPAPEPEPETAAPAGEGGGRSRSRTR